MLTSQKIKYFTRLFEPKMKRKFQISTVIERKLKKLLSKNLKNFPRVTDKDNETAHALVNHLEMCTEKNSDKLIPFV